MKLEDIRRDYLQGGLNREDLDANPLAQFEHWMSQTVDAGLNSDPTAMVLATVDASGQPSQRVVLLKGLTKEGFVFYTNYDSQKGRDLATNPKASLHFPWLPLERQVIVYGEATQLSEAESEAYFHSRPRASQIGAWTSHQSQGISSRDALDEAYQEMTDRFGHEEIPRPAFWGGYRVVPQRIEFWQGRSGRLHDRFMYQREGNVWTIQRLQP
ncbi:MAG: pyridoxamine 5'-phosphate oxidase [Saccharospirillum sp.]|uniref:pyridoxamine 5'-phosphate oxidase n=1 Tax=Saccharospirillum sp. TaxID=2033801 RepID=UPI0034A014F6